MLDLLAYAILLGIVCAIFYGLYLIPPVRRFVRKYARKHSNFLIVLAFGLFAAAVMYFIVLPRL